MAEGEVFLWVAFIVLGGGMWWFSRTYTQAGKEIVKLLNELDARIKDLDKRVSWLEELNKIKS